MFKFYRRQFVIAFCFCLFCLQGVTQNVNPDTWAHIAAIHASNDPDKVKLQKLLTLKSVLLAKNETNDSVYARLTDRIGLYEYLANDNYSEAIRNISDAIYIYRHLPSSVSNELLFASYSNLSLLFYKAFLYDRANEYHDTAVVYAERLNDIDAAANLRLNRCLMYYQAGEYQKCIDETSICLTRYNTNKILYLLPALYNRRAQALLKQSEIDAASSDADSALALAARLKNNMEQATALVSLAMIAQMKQNFEAAEHKFKMAIKLRKITGDLVRIAEDYTDFGNYFAGRNNNDAALSCYASIVSYAKKTNDKDILAKAFVNMGQIYFRSNDLLNAEVFYTKAFRSLGFVDVSLTGPPLPAKDFSKVVNKDLLLVVMGNKTEWLLSKFKALKDSGYLRAALTTAVTTDTLITLLRHEQVNNSSKLFWRQKTRSIYINAVEASYLAMDKPLAFYFMERSRAVLLNDQLNELGASSQISSRDMLRQQQLQLSVIRQQQALSVLPFTNAAYNTQLLALIAAKDTLEHFIKSLEKVYPYYYQYKYADSPTQLSALQKLLGENNQQFLEYLSADTVTYCLSIGASGCDFFKIDTAWLSIAKINRFNQLSSNYDELNRNNREYVSLSYRFYTSLFEKVKTVSKRLVICNDNAIIPFEALLMDDGGNHYLLERFAVSYVYSATVLLRKVEPVVSGCNFIGFAPTSFSAKLHMPDLNGSEKAIRKAASFYSLNSLFIGVDANKRNFMTHLSDGAIVNFYSHALSDSGRKGPAIFLYDSLIRMSELELIKNRATQLVILIACETNVGKNFLGEGIFSIARGFSSIHIPAVAATLWKTDENSIYEISTLFNEQLASGVDKDVALQSAKLQFLKNHHDEKRLSYYWASLILIGNTHAAVLVKSSVYSSLNKLIVAIIVCITIIIFSRLLKSRTTVN